MPPPLGRITVPLYVFIIDCLGVSFFGALAIFWTFLRWPQFNVGVFVVPFILLAFCLAAARSLHEHIKISRIEVKENGLQKVHDAGATVLKWEDVIRFEQSKRKLLLFFRSGKTIRIPADIRHFGDVERYCLKRIGEIGAAENAKSVPRPLIEVSLSWCLIVAMAVALALTIIIWELHMVGFS